MKLTRKSCSAEVAYHDAQTVPPALLVDAKRAAEMCSKSLRTWRAWDARGLIPRPVRIGGHSTLWRVAELEEWVAAGCPPRAEWEARKQPSR